ncbi:hypothetical protein BC941DRAFT_439372 [Chlamydoabsidia padenii]|nr:hypothetical protein BC941DRAFT_439372 [Chlamydoabsidia padenii]
MVSSSEIMHNEPLKEQVSGYMTSSLRAKAHSVTNTKRTVQQIIETAIDTRSTEKEKDVLRWVQFCVETCLSQQEPSDGTSPSSKNSSNPVSPNSMPDPATPKPTAKKERKKKSPSKNSPAVDEDRDSDSECVDDDDDDAESIEYHAIGASDDDYVPSGYEDDQVGDDQQVPTVTTTKKKKKEKENDKDDETKKKTAVRRKKEEDQPPFIQPNAGPKAVVSYFTLAHPLAASEKSGLSLGYFAKSYFFPSKESFNAFISVLNSAQKTIDICIFSLTDDDVADALIAAKKRNVDIRIITDNQQAAGVGADAERLQKDHGIPYKTDHTTGYMHNKFAVVDSKTLINGSFNWSKGARFKNRENIIITNLPYCIKEFQVQFEALWEEF